MLRSGVIAAFAVQSAAADCPTSMQAMMTACPGMTNTAKPAELVATMCASGSECNAAFNEAKTQCAGNDAFASMDSLCDKCGIAGAVEMMEACQINAETGLQMSGMADAPAMVEKMCTDACKAKTDEFEAACKADAANGGRRLNKEEKIFVDKALASYRKIAGVPFGRKLDDHSSDDDSDDDMEKSMQEVVQMSKILCSPCFSGSLQLMTDCNMPGGNAPDWSMTQMVDNVCSAKCKATVDATADECTKLAEMAAQMDGGRRLGGHEDHDDTDDLNPLPFFNMVKDVKGIICDPCMTDHMMGEHGVFKECHIDMATGSNDKVFLCGSSCQAKIDSVQTSCASWLNKVHEVSKADDHDHNHDRRLALPVFRKLEGHEDHDDSDGPEIPNFKKELMHFQEECSGCAKSIMNLMGDKDCDGEAPNTEDEAADMLADIAALKMEEPKCGILACQTVDACKAFTEPTDTPNGVAQEAFTALMTKLRARACDSSDCMLSIMALMKEGTPCDGGAAEVSDQAAQMLADVNALKLTDDHCVHDGCKVHAACTADKKPTDVPQDVFTALLDKVNALTCEAQDATAGATTAAPGATTAAPGGSNANQETDASSATRMASLFGTMLAVAGASA